MTSPEFNEPCPFCGIRIFPIKEGPFKRCPICGGRWYESGGGGIRSSLDTGGGGACAVVG
jgi:hypothetical protein